MKRTQISSSRRNTGPDKATRALVIERAKGLCEYGCGVLGAELQHRVARGMGGSADPWINEPPNLLWLCSRHHRLAETRDALAQYVGLWVSQYQNPALIALRPLHGPPVWLLPDGTTSPTCPQGETQ